MIDLAFRVAAIACLHLLGRSLRGGFGGRGRSGLLGRSAQGETGGRANEPQNHQDGEHFLHGRYPLKCFLTIRSRAKQHCIRPVPCRIHHSAGSIKTRSSRGCISFPPFCLRSLLAPLRPSGRTRLQDSGFTPSREQPGIRHDKTVVAK